MSKINKLYSELLINKSNINGEIEVNGYNRKSIINSNLLGKFFLG